jgi:nitrous oxidase accessory protein NosD
MIVPIDNMVVTQDMTISPGVYFLPSGIQVEGSNITLDGNGALLVGENHTGTGIFSSHGENITIKNISLQRYYLGIKIENTRNLTISGCTIITTNEIPANTIFLDIWIPVDSAYGSGILLNNVRDSFIQDNKLSHQMNGLLTYHCDNLIVTRNLANYCSG